MVLAESRTKTAITENPACPELRTWNCDDLAGVPCTESGQDLNADRLGHELCIASCEQHVGSARVKTVGLVVVLFVHHVHATSRRSAPLDRSVGVCTVQTERAFAVRPSNSLVVRKVIPGPTVRTINCWPSTRFNNHHCVSRSVTDVAKTGSRISMHDGEAVLGVVKRPGEMRIDTGWLNALDRFVVCRSNRV